MPMKRFKSGTQYQRLHGELGKKACATVNVITYQLLGLCRMVQKCDIYAENIRQNTDYYKKENISPIFKS